MAAKKVSKVDETAEAQSVEPVEETKLGKGLSLNIMDTVTFDGETWVVKGMTEETLTIADVGNIASKTIPFDHPLLDYPGKKK